MLFRSSHTRGAKGSNGHCRVLTRRTCSSAVRPRTSCSSPRMTSPRNADTASAPNTAGTWRTLSSRSSARARSPCTPTPTRASTKTDASMTLTESVRDPVRSHDRRSGHPGKTLPPISSQPRFNLLHDLSRGLKRRVALQLGQEVLLKTHAGRRRPGPIDPVNVLRDVADLDRRHSAIIALQAPVPLHQLGHTAGPLASPSLMKAWVTPL